VRVNLARIVLGWDKALVTADHLLSKAAEQANLEGLDQLDVLEWRLAPDMFTLRQQLQAVANLVRQWSARAAGAEVPQDFSGDSNVPQLQQILRDARAFLSALTASQFHERDEVPLTLDLRIISPTLPIGQWVTGFANTNILFHLSIAYAILRSRGVPLGKQDLFAGGL
jgi:hypothetical protein